MKDGYITQRESKEAVRFAKWQGAIIGAVSVCIVVCVGAALLTPDWWTP